MNKFTLKKVIAYILLSCLLVGSVPVKAFSVTSAELEKEKEEIERKKQEAQREKDEAQASLNSANSKVSAISGDLDAVGAELEEVDAQLVETLASIDLINEDIKETEAAIEKTTIEYEEAKAIEEEQYDTMKLRIKYMYEKGDYTYMQLLIESKNFSEMMNKAEYIEKLYDYDRKLLEKYIAAKERTLAIKEQLEDEKDALNTTLLQLEEEEVYLDELLAEKQAEYDDYEAMFKEAQAEASVYKARVTNQRNAIQSLEKMSAAKDKEIAQAKEAEAEAARKAAEEAAKRAAEEEARRSGNSGGGSVSSSGSSSSTAPSDGSGKTYASAAAFDSGNRGQDIINYAVQFVGNPYVYGGTSLTQGADCSGFIWRIYKDFGINLPRAGTSMRSIGTEVSYEEARPGDIICYAGHVALYMGGGQIVHASTQRTGIKISNATYKTWITIRRVI